MRITRRELLSAVAGAACISGLEAQSDPPPDWGGPIVDTHLHLRGTVDGNHTHMQGCGVTHAVLRARENAADQVKAIQQKYPGRFVWTASTDITKPEAESLLTQAVKSGAVGFGEIKSHVEADGPELRRMFALAADLDVSIMVHFQEVPHFDGEGVFATGFKRFEAMLKAYPKTRFIGHADAFWANVSADYANDVSYPSGPIVRGGVTDKLLADYANLYGDLSANSGNNALSRDAAFTKEFLARHQDKLLLRLRRRPGQRCRAGQQPGREPRRRQVRRARDAGLAQAVDDGRGVPQADVDQSAHDVQDRGRRVTVGTGTGLSPHRSRPRAQKRRPAPMLTVRGAPISPMNPEGAMPG
jgi:uncharacterized protein